MILIITACIKPYDSVENLAVKENNIRLEQYMDSLKFYIHQEKITDIIFCDNSNCEGIDEQLLINEAINEGKTLEILKFKMNEQLVCKKGKSYGELCIMDYIFSNSELIKKHDYFVKVTGRLKVENINKILECISNQYNYFVFLGNPVNAKSKKIDTRFYGMKYQDYFEIKKTLEQTVDESNDITLEQGFFTSLKENKILFKMIPFYPRITGVSGSTGIDYGKMRFKSIKYITKDILVMLWNFCTRWR